MPVGELFLAAFLQVLFEKLMSPELLNFARREGLAKKLDKWSKTLSRIEAVLDDTEEKHHTERAVKQWVDDLRDLAYDVEDILDEFATEALLRKLKGGDQASTSKVSQITEEVVILYFYLLHMPTLFLRGTQVHERRFLGGRAKM